MDWCTCTASPVASVPDGTMSRRSLPLALCVTLIDAGSKTVDAARFALGVPGIPIFCARPAAVNARRRTMPIQLSRIALPFLMSRCPRRNDDGRSMVSSTP